MNILVCGATGFIGRNILEHLAKSGGDNITAVCFNTPPVEITQSNKFLENVKWVKADLRHDQEVRALVQNADAIIQAAATTSGSKDIVNSPFLHVTDNAVMNSLIFRAAHEYRVKHVIFFSCTVMYPSGDTPLKEADFNANQEMHSHYFGVGWTKVYLEKQAEFFSRLGHTSYTIFRHSNIYGPYDKYDLEKSHVFGATMTKVMTNTDGKITVWGSGEAGRDLLYIDDLVESVALTLEKRTDSKQKPFALYNIGYGQAISIKELIDKMVMASGKKIQIEHDLTKPDIKTRLCLNCDRAKKELGWEVKTSLDEGIQKTMSWYKKNVL